VLAECYVSCHYVTVKTQNDTKSNMKRIFAWIDTSMHAATKAQAALTGKYMAQWFAEAVAEKLARGRKIERPEEEK